MGYRSYVTVAIGFPDVDAMASFVTERKLSGAINEEELSYYNVMKGSSYRGIRITNPDGSKQDLGDENTIMYAHFEDVKWYESYIDVQMHMGMIEKAKSLGLPTYYARIGEDYGDVECEAYEEACTDDDAQLKYAETTVDWLDSGFEVVRYLGIPQGNDQWTIKEAIKRRETDEQRTETSES